MVFRFLFDLDLKSGSELKPDNQGAVKFIAIRKSAVKVLILILLIK